MKLYLTRYSITRIEYESIEDGYTKLVLSRKGYPSAEDIPRVIDVDYWEVMEDEQ